MREIIDYVCLEDRSAQKIALVVRDLMAIGWQPLGGVSVSCDPDYNLFAQAMVKYAEDQGTSIAKD